MTRTLTTLSRGGLTAVAILASASTSAFATVPTEGSESSKIAGASTAEEHAKKARAHKAQATHHGIMAQYHKANAADAHEVAEHHEQLAKDPEALSKENSALAAAHEKAAADKQPDTKEKNEKPK